MALGEAIFEDFKLIGSNPEEPDGEMDLPKFSNTECCYELPVFAELSFTKTFNNDKSSVLWFYGNAYTGVLLELEEYVNGSWTKIADLNDATYGEYFAFGFFTNNKEEVGCGYQIDWSKVLTVEGAGKFRVKTVETNVFGTGNKYSLESLRLMYLVQGINTL
jgi:hypothetical protein